MPLRSASRLNPRRSQNKTVMSRTFGNSKASLSSRHNVLTTEGDGSIPYQLISSLGTGPLLIGSRQLGLTPGPLFHASASGLHPTLFAGYAGTLSETGRARAALQFPNLPVLSLDVILLLLPKMTLGGDLLLQRPSVLFQFLNLPVL